MSARIGVGVVMEELAGDPVLLQGLETLSGLAQSEQANIRADATHMLGLIGHPDAEAPVRQRLNDPDPNVREIAQEALEMLHNETDHG
jgi:HEAT repeat protein